MSAQAPSAAPVPISLPLGFLALAGGTTLLSALQLGWLGAALAPDVALLVIAFVVPLQLVASVFGFAVRDLAVGTAMGVLAGTWLAIGATMLTADRPGATNDALGLLLLVSAVAMLVPLSAVAGRRDVPAAVLATTAVRFAVTGVFQLTDAAAWKHVAGAVGLGLAVVAVVAAFTLAQQDRRAR